MKNNLLGKPEVNSIISMRENDAKDHLKEHNYSMRVINRDGNPIMYTRDYVENRVNVFIVDGKVSDIHNIG